jgi:hypothetical protein
MIWSVRHPRSLAAVRETGYAGILAGLNLYFCHELFRTEYFDNFQSNEGALASLGRFFARHPGAHWFPLWNIGLPAENTYSPLAPAAIAMLSAASGISAPLALHIIAGLFFCLVPVAWFWAAWKWGVQAECALAGGLLYSLLSPTSLLFHALRSDLAHRADSRRMMDLVYYGDIAHMIALALLPLALVALERALRTGRARACLAAVALCGLTALSNAFGITTVALGSLALVAALEPREMRRALARLALLGTATYLCVSPLLTPRLLALTARNSQMVGGDFRFSLLTPLGYGLLLGGLVALRIAARRARFLPRFVLGFAWLFGGIPLLYYTLHIPTLPQVLRYHLEIDMGICLLVALALWQLPAVPRRSMAAVALLLAVPLAIHVRRFDRGLLQPADILRTTEYRTSRWIDRNLPGVRTMVSGDVEFWFNLFSDNPQLSAGHEPFAPNFMQRVAVYTIYSGMNAGARDAEYSVFWLKAFGAGAVHVPGPASAEHYHPFVNPRKFEGVLPKLWQSGDDAIYAVPLRSPSLAHVIPAGAVVERQPIHGLDIGPAEAYVRALDDPALAPATLQWLSTDRARIRANFSGGQVLSVQVCYDPGWEARLGGRRQKLRADGLGMIVIEPDHAGTGEFDLEFTGGLERSLCRLASLFASAGLLFWAASRRYWSGFSRAMRRRSTR